MSEWVIGEQPPANYEVLLWIERYNPATKAVDEIYTRIGYYSDGVYQNKKGYYLTGLDAVNSEDTYLDEFPNIKVYGWTLLPAH